MILKMFNRPNIRVVHSYKQLTIEEINIQVTQENPVPIRRLILQDELEINEDLDESTRQKTLDLVNKYRGSFATSTSEIGCTNRANINIKLTDQNAVVYRPYRLSYAQRGVVKKMCDELLQLNIIKPSVSPYSSPVVLVKKKNGEDRMCVDFRQLNLKTEKDQYPMPRMDDLIDRLAGYLYFTTLDLASGYYQIPVATDSQKYTAFVTPDGHFEFLRMPFGLATAPAVFQRMMDLVTQPIREDVLVYLDDIIIPSRDVTEGLEKLEKFLMVMKQHDLTIRLSNASF